jgi:ubiquitin C-terminal hydrolase
MTLVSLSMCFTLLSGIFLDLFRLPSPPAPSGILLVSNRLRGALKGKLGITNLGNQCYLNSALQLFLHLDGFRLVLEAVRPALATLDPSINMDHDLLKQILILDEAQWSLDNDQLALSNTEVKVCFKIPQNNLFCI